MENVVLTDLFSNTLIDLLPGFETTLWKKPELYRRLKTKFESKATLIGFDHDHKFFFGIKEFSAVIIPIRDLEKVILISSIER